MSGRSYAKFFIQRVKPEHCRACGFAKGRKERKVLMRKALLIVAMLLVVAPVMATTTVKVLVNKADQFTAPDGNKVQPVSIAYVTDVDIRAFALDINIDSNGGSPNFQGIRNFKTGESNGAKVDGVSGYGIFPSRFRDFVNPSTPDACYALSSPGTYNPTVAWNEPETTDHNSGMGFPKMIVEMGTLYDGDPNKPAHTGTLFTFDVNAWGQTGTFQFTVKANALRGGVVNTDGNTITAAYEPNVVVFDRICTVPNVVNEAEAAATADIVNAGFNPVAGTPIHSDTVAAGNVISTNPAAGAQPGCSTTVTYVLSLGPCTVPNVVNQAEATATLNLVNAGFCLGTRTTTCSNTIAAGNVISTTPAAGATPGCGTCVAYVVSTGPCCTNIPAILAKSMTDANTAITGAGLTVGTITYECNDACAINKVCRQQTGCIAGGSSVWYVVSLGTAPGIPASITVPATDADGAYNVTWTAGTGATSYALESSAPVSGTTIYPTWVQIYSGTALTFAEKVGGGTWSYRVKSVNACSSSGYRTGGNSCVVTECLKTTATGYADWQKWRYPACWCFRRQCRGDTDGRKAGYWVSATPDLANFKAAYGKTDAQVVAIPCAWNATTGNICGICADVDHKKAGYRVSATPDLATFKLYYGKPDATVTCCDTAAPAGDCTLVAGDPFNFWTN
jgi:beta-lactam-binding protein with PASTA domain